MRHELVQRRKEVKLALDVVFLLACGAEGWHDLEDLLSDLGVGVAQALLQAVQTALGHELVHKADFLGLQ